jgi:predicted patatin/cPLA2 family phospholipase
MPLYIMASNLTKGKPTIFSENVPVLEALKCSCCIPGVFRPQILYNQVYVDGDIFVPSVDKFITSENVLCLSLKKQMSDYNFRPETIEEMSPIKYVHDIYTLVTQNFFNQVRKQCTLQLSYPGLRSMSDISELNVPDILETSGLSLSRFLRSKGRNKESPEV